MSMTETVHRTTTTRPAARPWTVWQDWTNLGLGAYLALTPLWTAAAPTGWFVLLGVGVALVALWALGTVSSHTSEWVQIALGAVVFLIPWLGGFAAVTAAAWTAWVVGAAVIVLAATAMAQHQKQTHVTTAGWPATTGIRPTVDPR